MANVKRTVEDFFDKEYREYGLYTIRSRAIPSVIDGLKPSHRKIAFSANRVWKTGNEKPMKVFQLAGFAANESLYHHGGLDGTIIGMTQTFKNSMPIFEGIGQFGSLRAPEPGAPRYISIKFNENFKLLYKDFDLTTPKFEEGVEIEPEFFLPIIPAVLLNGSCGLAVGHATNILNRHPVDLIDACLCILNEKACPEIRPWIKGFSGDFRKVLDAPRSWTIHGRYEIKNTTTVEVTELPPSMTYEKYEAVLDSLEEKGIITSYEDHSSEFPKYVIKFTRQKLQELQEKSRLDDILKLQEREGENFTTLDEFGNLKIFKSANEILDYFVNFRLGYYDLRKKKILQKLKDEIFILQNKSKFIKAIIDNTLKVNNRKKQEIEVDLPSLLIEKSENSYNYLLQMPIYSLTKEKFDELQEQIDKKNKEHDKIEKITPKNMYVTDLNELRKRLV